MRDPRVRPTTSPADSSSGHSVGGTSTYLYVPSDVEQRFVESLTCAGTSVIPPLRWCGGRLYVRVVSCTDGAPVRWGAAYSEASLVRKRKTDPQTLLTQIDRQAQEPDGLTARQSSTLLEAVRLGYYEMPRRSKVRDIARHLGIARSTAEEHLRVAESAMIRSSAPLVAAREQVRFRSGSPSEIRLFEELARFRTELDVLLQLALRDTKLDRLDPHPTRSDRKRPNGEPGITGPDLTWAADIDRSGDQLLRDEHGGLVDST